MLTIFWHSFVQYNGLIAVGHGPEHLMNPRCLFVSTPHLAEHATYSVSGFGSAFLALNLDALKREVLVREST